MSVLLFMIPITLILGLVGLGFFLWTLKTKQYEDLQGAANRILFDEQDEIERKKSAHNPQKNSEENKENEK